MHTHTHTQTHTYTVYNKTFERGKLLRLEWKMVIRWKNFAVACL